MQNIKTVMHPENRQVEINLTAFIPMAEGIPATDEEVYEEHRRRQARAYDIIGAFSGLMIASLEGRMAACQQKLLNHLKDAQAYGENLIAWHDSRNELCTFSIISYKKMESVVKGLSQSDWACVYKSREAAEQVLKALLNDTEQDHEDKSGFHYSELVTLLVNILIKKQ